MIYSSSISNDSLEDSDFQEVTNLLAEHAEALSPEVKIILAGVFKKVKKNSNPLIVNESSTKYQLYID